VEKSRRVGIEVGRRLGLRVIKVSLLLERAGDAIAAEGTAGTVGAGARVCERMSCRAY
jgi:predicted transcriptional regulator